jgi:hypothetical protein
VCDLMCFESGIRDVTLIKGAPVLSRGHHISKPTIMTVLVE